MLTDYQIIAVVVTAMIGALISGVLGWLDSGEIFIPRKFASTCLRAIIAGLIFASTKYVNISLVTVWDYVAIFLGAAIGGAGIDVYGNRGAGAVVSSVKTALTNVDNSYPSTWSVWGTYVAHNKAHFIEEAQSSGQGQMDMFRVDGNSPIFATLQQAKDYIDALPTQ